MHMFARVTSSPIAQTCAVVHYGLMTMQQALEFDKADRMRRALRVSGVSVQEMAEFLRVSRNTIGNWINGRAEPRPRDLIDFADKTGVPVSWIETGSIAGEEPLPSD